MRTTYTTESHRYLENVPCGSPTTCNLASHWEANDSEFASLPDAEEYARRGDDAPAVRITELRTVVQARVIKTVG